MNRRSRMIRALSYLLRLANVRLILPTELFIRLVDGDKLHAGEQTKSGSRLTGYDLKHARAMEIARRSFRIYTDTYWALAKS